MTVFADTITSGTIIGAIAAGLTLLICVVCIIGGTLSGRSSYSGDGYILAIGGVISAIVTALVWVAAMWPLKHDYHYWIEKAGTVQDVSKRLVSDGDKGMQEKIVITIGGQPYGITDTRASLLKPGDHVSINCKRAYEWGSSNHGWDCRWNDADYKGGGA